jgi:hypothetical protein
VPINIFPKDQSGAVAPEGEGIGEYNLHLHFTKLPWNIIEITILIPFLVIHCGRDEMMNYRKD